MELTLLWINVKYKLPDPDLISTHLTQSLGKLLHSENSISKFILEIRENFHSTRTNLLNELNEVKVSSLKLSSIKLASRTSNKGLM
jgi:hypothetical protein